MDDAYYSCPYCNGKVKIKMTEEGRLLLLEHKDEKIGHSPP